MNNSVIFIGNFLDDKIVVERKLIARNPAASNRILRIMNSLNSNKKNTYILSPGSSARIKFQNKLFLPAIIRRYNKHIVVYAPTISIPIISSFFELISMPFIFYKIHKRKNISIALFYCYYPSIVITAILAKLFNIKIIEDLEDIVSPKLKDWFNKSFLFTLQQLLGKLLMKIIISISDLIIVPSKNFIYNDKIKNKSILIDGCFDMSDIEIQSNNISEISVLMSGLINKENGIELFENLLTLLENERILSKSFVFNISGQVEESNNFTVILEKFKNVNIKFHGYLNDYDFKQLLIKNDLCLVLQNPSGRNSLFKTPSKGYEFMSYGKAIIVTKIGDYESLPDNTRILLNDYTSNALFEILSIVNKDKIYEIGKNALIYAKENWNYKEVGEKIIDRLK